MLIQKRSGEEVLQPEDFGGKKIKKNLKKAFARKPVFLCRQEAKELALQHKLTVHSDRQKQIFRDI